jgi:hypothetical protein
MLVEKVAVNCCAGDVNVEMNEIINKYFSEHPKNGLSSTSNPSLTISIEAILLIIAFEV